jgi:hypothetical protein
VGSVMPLTYKGQTYIVSQTSSGTPYSKKVNPTSTDNPARVSWHEVKH